MVTTTPNHVHGAAASGRGKKGLLITLGITTVILVAEVIGGLVSNSLALLSDAAHMLVDLLALGLAFFAISISGRPATAQKTYGYRRVEIMVALINGTILILLTLFIFYEAYQRLVSPPEIEAPVMLGVAFIGLIGNVIGIFMLREVSKGSLNIKAAFWHIIGDTISSVGVIVAAGIILFTGWRSADSIISILIGCIILWGSIGLVRESIDVLMESVPRNINVDEVTRNIKNVPGVTDVHDIHVWTITSGVYSMSAHIQIKDRTVSQSEALVKEVNDAMVDKFNISHTTLQLECSSCPTDLVCSLSQTDEEESKHDQG
jgi:cobalt-zinc-cadmium efflux system protein